MNVNYYNEFDKGAAAWLRELINAKLIPFGYVDERSITEVTASDVQGFTQCHFFAGIGGWSLALQLAGVPASTRLWTGSPPCQPFSTAGKQLGQFDERHLAPVFLNLVSKCKPPVLFGEQVAAAIGKSWMCDLQTHLEGEDYAVGFAVLPACSVGAPHKRDRLFFGATLAYTDDTGPQGRAGVSERADQQSAGAGSVESGLAYTSMHGHTTTQKPIHVRQMEQQPGWANRSHQCEQLTTECSAESCRLVGTSTNPHHGFWSDADWLGCRDGKFRPVEPGTFPLANGIPARVGRLRDEDLQSHPQKNRVMRLRGYGNAIVPQVAAEFVKAFMSCKAP